jgi:hypothetical protein
LFLNCWRWPKIWGFIPRMAKLLCFLWHPILQPYMLRIITYHN